MTWRQSAEVRSIHTSEASQRLHAGDLSKKTKIKHLKPFYTGRLCIQVKLNLFTIGFSTSASMSPSYISFSPKDDPVWVILRRESSFHISVLKKKGYKMLFQVLPIFTIQLHIKDLYLLEKIPAFFGVGVITKKSKSNSVVYSVQYLKDLDLAIIPRPSAVVRFAREAVFLLDPCQGQAKKTTHFDRYPLISQKWADYQLFKSAVLLLKNKEHLTREGFNKILSIRASMNLGLSEELKLTFPYITPTSRPLLKDSYGGTCFGTPPRGG